MRKYETKVVQQEVKQRHLVERTCDLCGRKAKDADGPAPWSGGSYDIDDTTIMVVVKREEGESCPSGGNKTTTEVDICPSCFKDKLLPWLVSQGAKPEITEVDW